MGAWDSKPWDNDSAADWFGDLFDEIALREKVVKTLQLDVKEYYDEIRAAAWVLIHLGRTYVWPIDQIDSDLKLAIERLEKVRNTPEIQETHSVVKEIDNEIAVLRHRLNRENNLPNSEEFRDWWQSHAG